MNGSHAQLGEEIAGTFGVASATHWMPAQTAMGMLERGGNAFDAAAAAGLVFHIVDSHMSGIGGEAVILAKKGNEAEPQVICGQGVAPERATIEAFRSEGFNLIPESGVMSAVVPGSFDAWMLMLKQMGTKTLREVLSPAIDYALNGFPVSHETIKYIKTSAEQLRSNWTGALPIYLPGNDIPSPGDILYNKALGNCLLRILLESEAKGGSRENQIDAARDAFYRGFVAEAIGSFLDDYADIEPENGREHRALLTRDDLFRWGATIEAPVAGNFKDWTVFKPGPWTQSPVFLQLVGMLENDGLSDRDLTSAESVHLIVEASKLAFADREAWYGDPNFTEVPIADLLDPTYNVARRRLIQDHANGDLRPGTPQGRPAVMPDLSLLERPTHPENGRERDTCHINVIDRWQNVASVTLSGGWFYNSPTIPELGFSLSTRAQMFWLQEGLASSLRPGSRPRTTLTPTIAFAPDGTVLSFGCRGADHSDQWLVQFFLRFAGQDLSLKQAIDKPVFASEHWPNSVFPRKALQNRVLLDSSSPQELQDKLRERGHDVKIAKPNKLGRTCAAIVRGKMLRAATTRYLKQSLAVGR
jgi:gamma-glutamyltranspeptidase/glutathione hydrolase